MTGRRLVALSWGALLVLLTGVPLVVALAQGSDPYDVADSTFPAPAWLTFGVLGVGLLTLVAAVSGRRRVGWVLLAAAPVVMMLAGLVNLDLSGSFTSPLWRVAAFGLVALVPAALLLLPRRTASV